MLFMANYRITCTRREHFTEPNGKAHVVAVGTGRSAGHFDTLWAVEEVLQAMEHGHKFYTQGAESGRVALVEKVVCCFCRRPFIRSMGERSWDTDIENLPHCEERSRCGFQDAADFGRCDRRQAAKHRVLENT